MKQFKKLFYATVTVAIVTTFTACQKDLKLDSVQEVKLLSTKAALGPGNLSLTAIADSYVRNGSYAGTNFGNENILVVKSDANSYSRKSYLKFNLSSISTLGVGAAKLKVYANAVGSTSSKTIRVYSTKTASWGEQAVNWNNAPMDTTYLGAIKVTNSGSYTVDVTKAVNQKLVTDDKSVSLLLMNAGAFDPSGWINFSSRSDTIASNAPKLDVTWSENDSTDVDKILANYKIVWNDEFEGIKMDTTKWSYRANGTKRNYAWVDGDRTISLDGNGNMVIKVTKEGDKYYVGQATSDGHFNPTYGYFECRAKMNRTVGPHVAFWLQSPTMGSNPSSNNPVVNGAEVDIFEYHRAKPGYVWQTIHINGYSAPYYQASGVTIPYAAVDEGYHTFGLLWTENSYKFYVDGYLTRETTFGLSKRSEYMILSTELTGFGGNYLLGTYPDSVIFDYVRVYQPK